MSLFRVAQTQRHPLLPVALLVASLASTTVAYMLTRGTGGLAVLWINNGLLAASLLLLPRGPAIQLAILCTLADGIAAAIGGSPPAQAMLIAGCDLAESVAVAALVRRVAGARLDMTSLSRFRRVALLAACRRPWSSPPPVRSFRPGCSGLISPSSGRSGPGEMSSA